MTSLDDLIDEDIIEYDANTDVGTGKQLQTKAKTSNLAAPNAKQNKGIDQSSSSTRTWTIDSSTGRRSIRMPSSKENGKSITKHAKRKEQNDQETAGQHLQIVTTFPLAHKARTVINNHQASSQTNHGYIFICSNATEAECLTLNLFGASQNDLHTMEVHINRQTRLFLFNYDSMVLMGAFHADGRPEYRISKDAFRGRQGHERGLGG